MKHAVKPIHVVGSTSAPRTAFVINVALAAGAGEGQRA